MIHTYKELDELELEEYLKLMDSGMLWELFPECTGDYEKDTKGEEDEIRQ